MKSIITFLVFHIASLAFSQNIQVNGFSARVSWFGSSYLFFTPPQNTRNTDLNQLSALFIDNRAILPEAIHFASQDSSIILAINYEPNSKTLEYFLLTLQTLASQTQLKLVVRGIPDTFELSENSNWENLIQSEHNNENLGDFLQRLKTQESFQYQQESEYQRLWVVFVTKQIHEDILHQTNQSWPIMTLGKQTDQSVHQKLLQNSFFPVEFSSNPAKNANKILALQKRAKSEVALLYRIPLFMYGGHSLSFVMHWKDFGSQQIEVMLQPPSISELTPFSHIQWMIALIIGLFLLLLTLKSQPKTPVNQTGFIAINPDMNLPFVPMTDQHQSLDFLNQMPLKKGTRLSANLDKVYLSHDKSEIFLEDTNIKNALLINRRRIRRRMIRSGDIFDIGDILFIFISDQEQPPKPQTPQAIPLMKFRPTKHLLPLGTGLLINQKTKQEYPLTKNITFIGQSEANDLIIFAPNLAPYHAKIQKIGSQYKLQNVSSNENIYVNRRRIDQRYLREGDEISFNGYVLKFRMHKMSSALQSRSKHAISSQHVI